MIDKYTWNCDECDDGVEKKSEVNYQSDSQRLRISVNFEEILTHFTI